MFDTCTFESQYIFYRNVARIFIFERIQHREIFQFAISINRVYRIIYLKILDHIDFTHVALYEEEAHDARYGATCLTCLNARACARVRASARSYATWHASRRISQSNLSAWN